MNEKCEVIIKNQYGKSKPFLCPKIVKQGTVLGSTLCSSSTAELCKKLDKGGVSIANQTIKAVLFVDDTITLNTNINDTINAHQRVILFSKS